MTFEREIEPFNLRRDALVKIHADQCGVKLDEFHSHTVYNPDIVLQANRNDVPMRYQSFMSLVSNKTVPKSIEITEKHKILPKHQPPKDKNENANSACYDLPPLSELTNEADLGPLVYHGGEIEALKRLDKMMSNKKWVGEFEKPKTAPNSLRPSTTVLSPYVTFGCLSSRLFFERLQAVLNTCKKPSQPPVSLMGQLMWREFYYVAAVAEPNFDKMVGNKICRQIPWRYDENLLEAWAHGRTG